MKAITTLTLALCVAGAALGYQESRPAGAVVATAQSHQPPGSRRIAVEPFFAERPDSIPSVAPIAAGVATTQPPTPARWATQQDAFKIRAMVDPFGGPHYANSAEGKRVAAANRKVAEATAAFKKAKVNERSKAEEVLADALSELFDQKTSVREKQITELESRLNLLRNQLEQRMDQKAQIVRLRLQTLRNEADGLTF